MAVNRRLLSLATAAMLQNETGRPIGLNEAPVPSSGQTLDDLFPYGVLYALPGAVFDESGFSIAWSNVDVPFQITSVGKSYEQAEWMADTARAAMLDSVSHPLVVLDHLGSPAMSVMGRWPDGGPGRPDEVGAKDAYSLVERFRIHVVAR